MLRIEFKPQEYKRPLSYLMICAVLAASHEIDSTVAASAALLLMVHSPLFQHPQTQRHQSHAEHDSYDAQVLLLIGSGDGHQFVD